MFDINYGYESPRPSEVRITEVRAPTDASVRLLKEMEQAAKDKVIQSVSVKSQFFESVIHKQRDVLSASDVYFVIYKLNGKGHTVKVEINDWCDEENVACTIRDAVAKDIANLISDAFLDIKF